MPPDTMPFVFIFCYLWRSSIQFLKYGSYAVLKKILLHQNQLLYVFCWSYNQSNLDPFRFAGKAARNGLVTGSIAESQNLALSLLPIFVGLINLLKVKYAKSVNNSTKP